MLTSIFRFILVCIFVGVINHPVTNCEEPTKDRFAWQKLGRIPDGYVRHRLEFERHASDGSKVKIELISGLKIKATPWLATVFGAEFVERPNPHVDHFVVSRVDDWEAGELFNVKKKQFVEADSLWLKPQGGTKATRNRREVVVDAPKDVEIRWRIWQRNRDSEKAVIESRDN